MRFRTVLASLLASAVAATTLLAASLLRPLALAEQQMPAPESCTCPGDKATRAAPGKFAEADLDEGDEIAALESLQLALSEVGDGASYVWHHRGGRLTGVVQPTVSFKDAAGNVCRHLVLSLTVAAATKTTEGIACRLSSGRWQLDG